MITQIGERAIMITLIGEEVTMTTQIGGEATIRNEEEAMMRHMIAEAATTETMIEGGVTKATTIDEGAITKAAMKGGEATKPALIEGVVMLTPMTEGEATWMVQTEGGVSGTGRVVMAILTAVAHETIQEEIVYLRGKNLDVMKLQGRRGDMTTATRPPTDQASKARDHPSTEMNFVTRTKPVLGAIQVANSSLGSRVIRHMAANVMTVIVTGRETNVPLVVIETWNLKAHRRSHILNFLRLDHQTRPVTATLSHARMVVTTLKDQ